MIEHAAVFPRCAVFLPTEAKLGIGHFPIKQITTMTFIGDDKVVLVDRAVASELSAA